MSTVQGDGGIPRLRDQHEEITAGSPLALLGMMVEVVRARFRGTNTDTSFVWRADPTPEADEQAAPGAPRLLYIEAGDGTDPEARDLKPAVFVAKEDTQLQQLAIGNRSDFDRATRTERFYMQAIVPMTLYCVSEARAESMLIADIVWFHVLSATNYIRAEFGITHIAPPVLGATRAFRRSEAGVEAWMTPISFALTVDFHWITRPVAPLLKEVHAHLKARGGGDAMAGAIAIASRTTRTR